MRTTNENERILENLGKNKRTRICPFSGKKWAKTGKKRANEIKPWRNRAEPKVSPNFDLGSPRPGRKLQWLRRKLTFNFGHSYSRKGNFVQPKTALYDLNSPK
jgi:hypothetical protein